MVCFDKILGNAAVPTFAQTSSASARHWREFWEGGGAHRPLGEFRSPLARAGTAGRALPIRDGRQRGRIPPPQESGLVNNGWYGKYHHEMIWWHCTHYALWGRWKDGFRDDGGLCGQSCHVQAQSRHAGIRWRPLARTIGDHAWWGWPLETTALLIWQQPHPIFYAELEYRQHPTRETLEKWRDVVFETADFMASYAHYDVAADRYVLGYRCRS